MPQVVLMATAMRLSTSLEALAALAAHLRADGEDMDLDPRVREILSAIARELLGGEAGASATDEAAVVGMTRTLLAQASELVADPAREPGWGHRDPEILQGTGRMSMAIAGAIGSAAATSLGGLGERLGSPGGTLLDAGTGAAWLAIALARQYPDLTVTGIDIFGPALALARGNVAECGLADRIDLRVQDVTHMDEAGAYDAVWLPMPFLPREIVPQALSAAAHATRPGGWVIAGTYAGPADPLSQLLVDLRTVRSGGHPWRGDDLVGEIAGHGLTDAHEVERTWPGPVRLFAGRSPA
jgi:2-polyprenyl-3-methyl-5-hydroxy-6-metoxy-1,4-benzoquinol methylase